MHDAIVTASAPGKVVLCGEYAVLDGAPAIAMAVDARAQVELHAASAGHHCVAAPGYSDRTTRFRDAGGELEWLDDGEPLEMLQHVWRLSGLRPSQTLSLNLDTCAFVDANQNQKIGIGSSAALAVSLAAAFAALQPGSDALEVAYQAHVDLQGGRGSGVDVACAAAGGLLEYRMHERQTARIDWPDGLECKLLWSGTAAATGVKIVRFEQGGHERAKAKFNAAARRMAAAWRQSSTAAILDEYRLYTGALAQLSIDHDLGIFDAGHAEVASAAGREGLVYKPCGAGGGDVGIVFASDADAIEDFIAGGLPAGFKALGLAIDNSGVEVKRSRP